MPIFFYVIIFAVISFLLIIVLLIARPKAKHLHYSTINPILLSIARQAVSQDQTSQNSTEKELKDIHNTIMEIARHCVDLHTTARKKTAQSNKDYIEELESENFILKELLRDQINRKYPQNKSFY
jgi:hypothetical protein